MGSQSDWETMHHAADTLAALGRRPRGADRLRPPHARNASTHMPRRRAAAAFKVIIAGAGGAAHLPGMTAAMTPLPVFGVPVESQALKGLDSLLSIVQMPAGVPVGTLAIGKAGADQRGSLAAAVIWRCRRRRDIAAQARRLAGATDAHPSPITARAHDGDAAPQRIAPGSTIGILGGGQLGRMTALAAARLGYRCHTFADQPDSPAAQVCAASTVADYETPRRSTAFAAAVDVVTLRVREHPGGDRPLSRRAGADAARPDVLAIGPGPAAGKELSQSDRHRNRALLRTCTDLPSLEAAVARIGRPCVLKTARFGYDGKGQVADRRRYRPGSRRWARP